MDFGGSRIRLLKCSEQQTHRDRQQQRLPGQRSSYLRHLGLKNQRFGAHPRDVDVDLQMQERYMFIL